MTRVDVRAAKANLPELLDRAEQGELVSITRDRGCQIDLVPRSVRSRRAAFFGSWEGQVDMSRFDEADEEIAREFGMLD